LTAPRVIDGRRYSSVLGCIEVAGLRLGLSPCSEPAHFLIEASSSDAEFSAEGIVQHDARTFTLSAPSLAACDVRLDERSIVVRAARDGDGDRVAHFVVDNVLPRVAGLDGLCLHAAAVAVDDRAFVLIGPSGAGKSTLATRLALEGALLLGDDCAYIKDGLVHPTHRPSRLWPDSACLLGVAVSTPDGTGKVSVSEPQGVMRGSSPVPLHEVLVVDRASRTVDVAEGLELLLSETLRLVIPSPMTALDRAVEFLGAFGPRRTIQRRATLADLRAY
jgi:hypothetical protein